MAVSLLYRKLRRISYKAKSVPWESHCAENKKQPVLIGCDETAIYEKEESPVPGKATGEIMKNPRKTNGFREFIYILSAISISLGVTNLLPFPPLDGGKIVLILLEAIRRKPLKQETEIKIQLAGFAVLMAVSIVVTYHDIIRIF